MSGLFGGGSAPAQPFIPAPPALPPPPEPKVMPQQDPMTIKAEERRKLARARSRATTRAATILGSEDTLG